MRWIPSFSKCLVVLLGIALVGCGSAADNSTETTSTAAPSTDSTAATSTTLVTLELPGMT